MTQHNKVRFDLPDYVKPTLDAFDGAPVTVEYDSNYSGHGETVTVSGTAELDTGDYPSDTTHLIVDGRHIRGNRHVFNSDGRHLGTVERIAVTVPEDTAIDLVTNYVSHDIDKGDNEIIIQTWDKAVIEREGFMAGTNEFRLERV